MEKIVNIFKKHKFIMRMAIPWIIIQSMIGSIAHATNLNKSISEGLYEMAYSISNNSIFLAGAQSFKLDQGGIIYQINPDNLNITQIIHSDLKPFGAAINNITNTVYFTNTINGAITAIDAYTGNIIKRIILDNTKFSETHKPLKPRELVVDEINNRLYVTGVGTKSVVWVIDSKKLKLISTIHNTGIKATGLALNSKINKLYVTNSEGEILTINTKNNTIEKRKKIDPTKEHMFLNIALDLLGQRIFLSDMKQSQLFVLNIKNQNIIHKINVPESLAILFNPKRNEIYTSHREANSISIIDVKNNYRVKKVIKVKDFPNSLALSPDGNILFVSIKHKKLENENVKSENFLDQILKINLSEQK